jgi:hypothetical protein
MPLPQDAILDSIIFATCAWCGSGSLTLAPFFSRRHHGYFSGFPVSWQYCFANRETSRRWANVRFANIDRQRQSQ